MAAVGPLVGGWLATDVSWRWAFWLNIPFGLLTLLGIRKYLVETRDPERQGRPDVLGVPLSALGIGGIVFALIEGRTFGWWLQDSGALSPVPVSLVLGATLLAAFIVFERRRAAAGKVVLIDLGLLRIRSFRFGVIAALVVAAGEFGMLFTLPLLLQGALHRRRRARPGHGHLPRLGRDAPVGRQHGRAFGRPPGSGARGRRDRPA